MADLPQSKALCQFWAALPLECFLSRDRFTVALQSAPRAMTPAGKKILCYHHTHDCLLTSSSRLDGEVVVFLVGTEAPKRFTVHEDIVKPSSEFVQLALRGDWKEASTRKIPLPDDEPDVFSVCQHWLYDGLVHTSRQSMVTSSESDEEYELLVKAYILGSKLIDAAFKNSVIDAVMEKVAKDTFNKRLTSLVFENTLPASPLRRLWLDVYYHVGKAEWLEPALTDDTLSSEFMIEFSRYQMQKRASSSSTDKLDLFPGHQI